MHCFLSYTPRSDFPHGESVKKFHWMKRLTIVNIMQPQKPTLCKKALFGFQCESTWSLTTGKMGCMQGSDKELSTIHIFFQHLLKQIGTKVLSQLPRTIVAAHLELELHGADCISQLVVAFPLCRVHSLLQVVLSPSVAHHLLCYHSFGHLAI